MKENQKMFCFDLDGTFLSNRDKYSRKNKNIIKKIKEAGHIPVVVTGRTIHGVLRIKNITKIFDWFILNDGAYAYHTPTKKYLYIHKISDRLVENLIKIGKDYQALIWYFTPEKVFRYRTTEEQSIYEIRAIEKGYYKKDDVSHINTFDKANNVKNKVAFGFLANEEATTKINQDISKLKTKYSKTIYWNKYTIIGPHDRTKLTGVLDMAKKHNIDKRNIYAFGDSFNDIPMLKGIKNSYAMGQGISEVKKVALKTIGNNKSDAIYREIKLILKSEGDK